MPSLRIGSREVRLPIIQGGMGARVSKAGLASAVADQGCIGVIAAAGIGKFEDYPDADFTKVNKHALRNEIAKARSLTRGVIGVNLMVASADYEDMVQTAVDEDIDIIISGAGLPLELPKFIGSKDIGLVPVVSSARTLKIICKRWLLRYNRLPDAVIVEGPQAGGHLGYGYDDLVNGTVPNLKDILMQVLEVVSSFDKAFPVIAAGGIFDGGDIARYLSLGASGVQMATRFVCTEECDAHPSFKQAYVGASREDLTIIKSPVGLPGRVIKSAFVEKINRGETMPFRCKFQCLRTCDPTTAPYCIAKVLANAVEGDLDNAFVFAGANAYKCKEIVTVKKLIEQLEEEYARAV